MTPTIDPALLAALDSHLEAALDLPAAERAALLDGLRREQPALARELEALLAAESALDEDGFLSASGIPRPEGRFGLAGQRLGAYTLERPLGQGGMGTVWLGRRSDGRFQGTVAIKLPNVALLDPVGAERFRREGELLARLNHPAIARLLDAGVADDTQPYLVLEHVVGQRIDRYADQARLAPQARLRLFLEVLEGVGHAHANLVVHRDLKPSNILVTAEGRVKLLDFGIAKLLDDGRPAGEMATLTADGGRMLTPEYAAPEQVAGGVVTTATDVYALGVLLYVLLAGRHPTGGGSQTAVEFLQGVVDTEPPRLSMAVSDAERHGLPVDRLRKLYAGDLDNIVAKALKKRPGERYATVAALAEDLRRHLAHEPVSARPDSWRYRARKFVRRHRAAVAAASITTAALLGATIFSLVQLREARRQRDSAVAASRRQTAMLDVQTVLAGSGGGGVSQSASDRIRSAERMVTRKYRNEPDVEVEVLVELASRLYDLTDMKGTRRVLDLALGIARESRLPAYVALVQCMRAFPLIFDEQLDSAAAVLAEARRSARQAGGLPTDFEVTCLNLEGRFLVASGRPDSAISLLERAVTLAAADSTSIGLHMSRNSLADALRMGGRTREAARYQQELLLDMESTGYIYSDVYPAALGYFAVALAELGEFRVLDSVAGAYIRGLETEDGTAAVSAPVAIIYGFNKLRKGDVDSGAVWLAAAIRDTSSDSREANAMWLPPARLLLLLDQRRLAEARRAIRGLPLDTPTRRITAAWLGARLRRAEGDTAGARAALDSALVAENAAGTPAPRLIYALLSAAEWRQADGYPREADSLARLALAGGSLDSLAARRSAHVGRAELVRAHAAASLGDRAGALAAARRAVAPLENGFGPGHRQAAEARALLDSLK